MSPSQEEPDTISVVIPCYNGENFIRETIESVLNQTHLPLEILVVDDGSTDHSAQIAESFGSPVRVIRQVNQGESVARNRGLDEAQGNWVAFLDADDLWMPEKLAAQVAAIEPSILAIHTNYRFFGGENESVDLAELPAALRYDLVRVCTLQNRHFNLSSLMVRKDYLGRFPTWTRYAEDLLYFAELLLHEPQGVALVPQELVAIRRHPQRQSADPRVQLHWHETLMSWSNNQAARMPAGAAKKIETALIQHLVKQTEHCYWRRDWKNYWLFRQRLAKYPDNQAAKELLARRVYPAWLYQMKDWLDRRRGQEAGSPATHE